MSEKVVLTKKQADAVEENIKFREGKSKVLDLHSRILLGKQTPWGARWYNLNELTIDEMARALYVGYEVEPEFKENEWVYDFKRNKVFQLNKQQAKNLSQYNRKFVRHATDEEIAKEKKRMEYKKFSDLKPGSLLYFGGLYEFIKLDLEEDFPLRVRSFSTGRDDGLRNNKSGRVKVICHYEDRKDVDK